MTNIIATLLILIIASPAYCGTIDDFEGGVDWGASPWYAQTPTWNIDDGETITTDAINPEWKITYGDQTAGPDFQYLSHDLTKGADGTSASLKVVVTGGNYQSNQAGKIVYGQGPKGTIYMTGQPAASQTFTVNGTVFTMQAGARSGAGQVQIGATIYATAQNMAAAINADISVTNIHAVANTTTAYPGLVTISFAGTDPPVFSTGTPISELMSNAVYYSTPSYQGLKSIYNDFPSLISTENTTAGGFYITFGSIGGSLTVGNNNRLVVPPAIQPDGSNKLQFYILSPNEGSISSQPIEQGLSFGTYINNTDRKDAGCSTIQYHMYHNLLMMKSNYWQKIIIDENPEHVVGMTGTDVYTPNNPTRVNFIPTCNGTSYPMDYLESIAYFYVDQVVKHARVNPTEFWFDEFKFYHDERDTALEYVANRSAAYLGDDGTMVLGWTGRWGTPVLGAPSDLSNTTDNYKVYYSTTQLNGSNFNTIGIKVAGTFTRLAGTKIARAVFVIPNFDETVTYSFAISPDNEPTTASFIDYKSGPPVAGTSPVCDSDHLYLCNESNCPANWCDSVCQASACTPVCDPNHLYLCNEGGCSTAGGYWCDGACQSTVCDPEPTCFDQIKNGNENGVDCGGSCPEECVFSDTFRQRTLTFGDGQAIIVPED